MDRYSRERQEMIDYQLTSRGIADTEVLAAMAAVPREQFVPLHLAPMAYEDHPLPIGNGQTISQPYMVALMAEALQLRTDHRVLEIGTGSGYSAAILSRLAAEVYTIERIPELAERAAKRLEALGCRNVHVRVGDGTVGLPEYAPFDGISVTAAAPDIPRSLREQLAVGGRLVIPVGRATFVQSLLLVTRVNDSEYRTEDLGLVAFVPLVGQEGWMDE